MPRETDAARTKLSQDGILWMFLFLLVLVCAFGGGSRSDIATLGWLRSAIALIVAASLYGLARSEWYSVRQPLVLLGGLAALMILQLIPLPAYLWSTLPERSTILEIDRMVGLGDVWRPLTLSPSATWNSLASLIVPLGTVLLLARMTQAARSILPLIIVCAGVVSSMLGIAQVVTGGLDALHFYDVTNEGSAVGLFANRNHNGTLLAVCVLIAMVKAGSEDNSALPVSPILWATMASLLLAGILVNGSRAGLVSLVLATGLAALTVLIRRSQSPNALRTSASKGYIFVAVTVFIIGVIGLFAFLDRNPAVERFLGEDTSSDLRWRSLGAVWELAWSNFPFGVGFGAFESAYRMVEPRELLSPLYFNQAHNDWLQLIVEGGLLGVLLLVSLTWLVSRNLVTSRTESSSSTYPAQDKLMLCGCVGILAFASLVDYPLRTPIIMLFASWVLTELLWKSSVSDGI